MTTTTTMDLFGASLVASRARRLPDNRSTRVAVAEAATVDRVGELLKLTNLKIKDELNNCQTINIEAPKAIDRRIDTNKDNTNNMLVAANTEQQQASTSPSSQQQQHQQHHHHHQQQQQMHILVAQTQQMQQTNQHFNSGNSSGRAGQPQTLVSGEHSLEPADCFVPYSTFAGSHHHGHQQTTLCGPPFHAHPQYHGADHAQAGLASGAATTTTVPANFHPLAFDSRYPNFVDHHHTQRIVTLMDDPIVAQHQHHHHQEFLELDSSSNSTSRSLSSAIKQQNEHHQQHQLDLYEQVSSYASPDPCHLANHYSLTDCSLPESVIRVNHYQQQQRQQHQVEHDDDEERQANASFSARSNQHQFLVVDHQHQQSAFHSQQQADSGHVSCMDSAASSMLDVHRSSSSTNPLLSNSAASQLVGGGSITVVDSLHHHHHHSMSSSSGVGVVGTVMATTMHQHQQNHLQQVHEPELKVCEWEGCENTFLDMKEFVKHLEDRHVNQEPKEKNRYFCLWSNCKRNEQEFNARYKLLIHMRVHSGEKPYPCENNNCKKSFSRLENLKIHVRSHTGEKPYKCNFDSCSKSFTNSSDRIKHHKTHRDPKPYSCNYNGCTKRYTDPSSLRKHLRAHKRAQLAPDSTTTLNQQQQQQHHLTTNSIAQTICPPDFDPASMLADTGKCAPPPNQQQYYQANQYSSNQQQQQHSQFSRSWCAGSTRPPADDRTLVNVGWRRDNTGAQVSGEQVDGWASGQCTSGGHTDQVGCHRNEVTNQQSVEQQHGALMRSMPSTVSLANTFRAPSQEGHAHYAEWLPPRRVDHHQHLQCSMVEVENGEQVEQAIVSLCEQQPLARQSQESEQFAHFQQQ